MRACACASARVCVCEGSRRLPPPPALAQAGHRVRGGTAARSGRGGDLRLAQQRRLPSARDGVEAALRPLDPLVTGSPQAAGVGPRKRDAELCGDVEAVLERARRGEGRGEEEAVANEGSLVVGMKKNILSDNRYPIGSLQAWASAPCIPPPCRVARPTVPSTSSG